MMLGNVWLEKETGGKETRPITVTSAATPASMFLYHG